MIRNGAWWCPTPAPSVLPTPDWNNSVKCKKFLSVAKSRSGLRAFQKGEEAGTAQAVSLGQSVCQISSGDVAMMKPGELDRTFLRSVVSRAAEQGMTFPWFLLEQEQGGIGLNQELCTRQEQALCTLRGTGVKPLPQGITGATALPGLQE